MTAIQLEVQSAHGFVPLLVVLLMLVIFWAGIKVGKARELYGVNYPQMYAEQSNRYAKAFNCLQRGHQNNLEQTPIFLALLFTSSVYRPQIVVIAGLVRVLGFIVYMRGYSSGDPKKRLQGLFGLVALLVNAGLTVEVGLRMVGGL
ncbi:Microsomal Glutathione S-transferase [Phytophthora cinnamomi]|uniref:Microsomal Glutathione S-transferase n=1 Tax=Phytophthora cinnamomi TaxID=4785 RepID=UPI00355942FB|nr:Microsomal Glutathione S-transferase [Phytophthora cinnamomi]KAG6597877.1 Microsomal Glutathione S-transferase [Phytophthora cinnamomi]